MLTPAFELSQDDEFITVLIKTPYVKIADVDFYISGTEFKFYVKPYFLRLNLPGDVVEDGRESASYDIDKGTFSVKLPKLQPGEFFEGLDMLTTLLAPKKKAPIGIKPLIEIAGDDNKCAASLKECDHDENDNDDDDDSTFDWEVEQHVAIPVIEDVGFSLSGAWYGFANQKSGLFKGREAELHEIAEITDPESMTLTDRRSARQTAEDVKFDAEYYLADYFGEDQIQHLLDYTPPWEVDYQNWKENHEKEMQSSNHSAEPTVQFTEEEKDRLRRLPNKEYLLEDKEELQLYLGLVDIVFAYLYNHRTTEGENTVESPWTISRISSTFSWFESFSSLRDVLVCCARRTMCYPLYRHWSLVEAVIEDIKKIFLLGRRQLLKCLLEVHALFCEGDPWYLMNELYVTDYCVWIQKTSRKKLSSLAQSLQQIQIRKSDLGWQLEELETAANLVQQEEEKHEEETETCTEDEDDEEESTDTECDEESVCSEENSDSESVENVNSTELLDSVDTLQQTNLKQ